jgi:hypothetical protein
VLPCRVAIGLAIVLLGAACQCGGGSVPDAGSEDGGPEVADGGGIDAGAADAGSHDGGAHGLADAGATDAGTRDAGGNDSGLADSGTHDGGSVDAGSGDGGTGDPCAGVACNTPPPPYCFSATVLRSYTSPGTCTAGACTYPNLDSTCQFGCDAGTCNPSSCTTPCSNWTQCTNPGEGCDVSSGCCVPCGGSGAPCCVDFVQGHFSCNSGSDVCGLSIGSATSESYYCCHNAGDGCCEQGGCVGGTCCKCPPNGPNFCVDPAFGCGGC